MNVWWRHLTGRPFYWVLDGSHAAAHLFMLRHVVERPEDSAVVRAARLTLAESPEVTALKAGLAPDDHPVTERYGAPFWRLCLLAELGVPCDVAMAEVLDAVIDPASGVVRDLRDEQGLNTLVLYVAAALGFADDPRSLIRFDALEAALTAGDLPADHVDHAGWLTLAASALAEIPEAWREPALLKRLSGVPGGVGPDDPGSFS